MTLHDVVRSLVRAAHQHGQLGEAEAADALAAIDNDDPQEQERRSRPPELSDAERAQLEQLQAKQQAAADFSAQQAAPAPLASVPGAGFNQAGGDGS